MGTTNHELKKTDSGWTCEICLWQWKREPYRDGCPGVPRYNWETSPQNLRTTKQLRAKHMKPGGPARGCVHIRDSWCYLYDEGEAVPVREMSEAQRASLEKARARARLAHCPACGRDVDKEFFNRKAGICWNCMARIEEEEEISRQKEARDSAVSWARARMVEKENCVVLDTETTELDHPEIVEIAVISLDGDVLLNERVMPLDGISPGAAAVHGITHLSLAGCPGFPGIFPRLEALLRGKTVVSYNAAFDERAVLYTCQRHGLPALELKWECAMEAFAEYIGEWSNYWHSWKWQPLHGGDHTALGDCHAALSRIKQMAGGDIIP